ncbi:MAG TPA: geranylgeranyl reductase family protein [Thermoplasmata archaeon]|nr:geranylgeranyl reductase family protein [Thermoplasmata archaeon]
MERFDVVVVGAGPAGSTAARFAAEGGASTLLVDRRPELGEPVQCGEFLPTPAELTDLLPGGEAIERSYWIPPETVLQETHAMRCVTPGGRELLFPLEGVSVSRRAFDKRLALAAEGAGAELRFPAGVTRCREGRVEFAGRASVESRTVIGADGPLSTVGRSVGFAPRREMYRMITGSCAGTFADEIALFFGRLAPGGYAWVIPKGRDANVGLGVRTVPRGATLSRLLDRFTDSRGLPRATERSRWWVPLGPPPESAVRGSALFVGDAANLVMATNGGGIPTAILSGYDAGVVAAAHVRQGVPLSEYDVRWRSRLAVVLERGYRIKRWGDRFARSDLGLSLGMRYLGSAGMDAVMRMRWPRRLGGSAA